MKTVFFLFVFLITLSYLSAGLNIPNAKDNAHPIHSLSGKKILHETNIEPEESESSSIGKILVTIGNPFNGDVYVSPGSTLNQLVQQCQLDPQKFIIVKRDTWDILDMAYVLNDGDQLALCHNVTVSHASGKTSFLVEHQEPLQNNTELVRFVDGHHLANANETNKTEVVLSFQVMDDLDFVLCSLITTDGVTLIRILVESGKQQLGETALKEYLEPGQYYEVWDSVDTSRFYSLTDVINKDTRMTITDKCDSFNKANCWYARAVCDWNKRSRMCARKGTMEDPVGLVRGAVIGIGVGVGVVVVIVIVAVVVVVIKKRKD